MPKNAASRKASATKTTSTSKTTSKSGAAALPAALAARASAAADAKTKRLRAEGKALLALIARRKRSVTEAFYDIGEALARLKDRALIAALGRPSFADVCSNDAGISVSVAERLVAIVGAMTREQALAMGQKKAMAMVTLAAATPAADTAVDLYRTKSVALPGGKSIAPRTATANEIEEAATTIRHGAGAPARGRTTTAEERTFAALLERRLHQLGAERARVTAVATKPGQGADLRFEHIPAAAIDALRQAIGR